MKINSKVYFLFFMTILFFSSCNEKTIDKKSTLCNTGICEVNSSVQEAQEILDKLEGLALFTYQIASETPPKTYYFLPRSNNLLFKNFNNLQAKFKNALNESSPETKKSMGKEIIEYILATIYKILHKTSPFEFDYSSLIDDEGLRLTSAFSGLLRILDFNFIKEYGNIYMLDKLEEKHLITPEQIKLAKNILTDIRDYYLGSSPTQNLNKLKISSDDYLNFSYTGIIAQIIAKQNESSNDNQAPDLKEKQNESSNDNQAPDLKEKQTKRESEKAKILNEIAKPYEEVFNKTIEFFAHLIKNKSLKNLELQEIKTSFNAEIRDHLASFLASKDSELSNHKGYLMEAFGLVKFDCDYKTTDDIHDYIHSVFIIDLIINLCKLRTKVIETFGIDASNLNNNPLLDFENSILNLFPKPKPIK